MCVNCVARYGFDLGAGCTPNLIESEKRLHDALLRVADVVERWQFTLDQCMGTQSVETLRKAGQLARDTTRPQVVNGYTVRVRRA